MQRARNLRILIVLLLLVSATLCTATVPARGQAAPSHPVRSAESSVLHFVNPVSVAVDRREHIYVFQRGTSAITAFSPQGQLLATWPVKTARTFPGPGRLAIDGGGNVSVLLGNSRQRNAYLGGIETFSPDGRALVRRYSPALLNAQLLAAGSSSLYVVVPVSLDGGARQSGRVVQLSNTGRITASWLLPTAGYDFLAPAGIATDIHGTIYITGSVGSCSRGCQGRAADVIERFTPGGARLPILRFPPGTVALGPGLAVDRRGDSFAGGGNHVTKVSPTGLVIGHWGGTTGCAPLEFRSIAGVALEGQNALYVVDESNDNVHRVNVATQSVTLWGGCPAIPPPTLGAGPSSRHGGPRFIPARRYRPSAVPYETPERSTIYARSMRAL